jgi:CHAD domain-containing protein
MVTKLDEVERKHEGGRLTAEIFAGLPGIAAILGPDHHALRATYYDTDDLRLYAGGITLRRRTGGDDAGWHAKLPVGPEHRRELHARLAASTEGPPRELTGLLPAYTAGRRLSPCAHIATERESWQLVDERGAVLAEVVLDSVRAQALRKSRPIKVWQEIEVELATDSPALLEAVSKRLTKAGMPRSDEPSKLARALGRLKRTGKAPGRKASAGEVLIAYLRTQVDALHTADTALRLDETEAVHDMRVSVRRLRSCLRVFRDCFDRTGIRTVTAELKWLSDLLGNARDAEVLRGLISGRLAKLPDDLILGPVHAEVDRHLARPETNADAELRTALAGNRYLALITMLDELLTNPPLRDRAGNRADKVLPRQVRKSYRKVRSAVGRDPEALHTVRKKAKQLRYACDAVEPVIGKQAKKTAKRTRAIQRTLGDHHDNVVLGDTLRELGAQAQLAGTNGFTFGLLLGEARERAARQEQRFAGQWRQLAKPKARRWMS